MGYSLFASRKLYYCAIVSKINAELDAIVQKRLSLVTLSTHINDGVVTPEEIASDPANLNSYLGFIQGSQAYNESEKGGGTATNIVTGLLEEKNYADEEKKKILKLLGQQLGEEYAKEQTRVLNKVEAALDIQQKQLETKLTIAKNQLQAIQDAEGEAIKDSTPKYNGVGGR